MWVFSLVKLIYKMDWTGEKKGKCSLDCEMIH